MNKNKFRRQLFANQIHIDLFLLVASASLIPTLTISIFLFFLIFHITADQIAIPEIIAYHIFPAARKVFTVLVFVIPVVITAILIFAHKMTHRIVGPYDRIVREIDECLQGKREGPIRLRDKDKFWPLVRHINLLLEKLKEK